MKFAFTAKGTEWDSKIDPRFGRTEFILLYDDAIDQLSTFDNRMTGSESHGVGPKTAQKLFDKQVDVLITGNGPGGNAAAVLDKAGIKIYVGAGDMNVKDAFDAFKKGLLRKQTL